MKQLQYRIRPYMGQAQCTATDWSIYGEATIVSKEFKRTLRTSSHVSGETQYRLVDTKTQPEQAMVWNKVTKTYAQPTQ